MEYEGRKIYYDRVGYAIVWIEGKNKKVHILVWEKLNGAKPKGFDIHHIDEDKGNWSIENLRLASRSNHYRIHAGWVEKNGKWIAKPCKDCGKKLPLNAFYQRKGLTPSQRCIKCSAPYFKEKAKSLKHKARRKIYMKNYYKNNKEKWL